MLSDGTSIQFSSYFQYNYIPHLTACQQFNAFSFLLNQFFGAMHTMSAAFLSILSVKKI